MSLATRMDKMVSFRLSEEEYEQFVELCRATHARSVSEVARTAMQYWLDHAPDETNGDLQHKVQELEEQVDRLTAAI